MGEYCKREEIKAMMLETIEMLNKDIEGLQMQIDHQFTEVRSLKV